MKIYNRYSTGILPIWPSGSIKYFLAGKFSTFVETKVKRFREKELSFDAVGDLVIIQNLMLFL